MKDFLKYIFGLSVLVIFGLTACQEKQIVEVPISPDGYPKVTVTMANNVTSIREGESLTFNIAIDKMLDRALTFSIKLLDGGTADEDDFEYETVVINPFSKETTLTVNFLEDADLEVVENLKFEIGVYGIGDRYLVNPANVNYTGELAINPAKKLDAYFDWTGEDDIDFVVYKMVEDYTTPMPWSVMAATAAHPEADNSISLDEPGTYYIDIIHWGAPNFDYTFTLGNPDGNIQTITGTFTADNLSAYHYDNLDAWTGYVFDAYRVIEVVNNGTTIIVNHLAPLTATDYITDPTALVGTWSGTDGALPDYGFPTNSVVVTDDAGSAMIYGLNIGWMTNFWGESITSGNPVEMILYANGDVVIPKQYYWTTEYDGSPYDYNIYGAGTYDVVNGLHIEYEMDQDGSWCSNWTYANGYNDYRYFQADVTKGKQTVKQVSKTKAGFVKPNMNLSHRNKTFVK